MTTLLLAALLPHLLAAQPPVGYYRQPTIQGDTIVFVAEGDLWKVSSAGGVATRLTSHPGDESSPRLSPDGSLVAFTARYEGPTDVYIMPTAGGLPKRLTYDAARCAVVGWTTPSGGAPARVIASSVRFSTLPNTQLTLIDPAMGAPAPAAPIRELVPLAQASDGVYTDTGDLVFTRLAFQGSQTKRYKGGTTQNLWKFAKGADEATPLTPDFTGTSATPMWWNGRIFFLTDRDGTMEVFSMKPDGSDVTQVTNHTDPEQRLLDVKGASMSAQGKIVFQMGADLWLFDAAKGTEARLNITLDSDFDQTRENWVEKPLDYLSAAAVAPDGSRVALTARGQVFVASKDPGRLVEVTRKDGVRYRNARFMPDGKTLVMLSDESGEVELWSAPSNGSAAPTQLTSDGAVLRWEAVPSPDAAKIAHHDKNQKLWIYDTAAKTNTLVETNPVDNFQSLAWSPDSRFLAYVAWCGNFNRQVRLYDTQSKAITPLTSDRFDSTDVAFAPDGKWLYIISDRNIDTSVPSPWGPLQPEPFFDNKSRLYTLALTKGLRSPFKQPDELYDPKADEKKDDKKEEPKPTDPAPAATPSTTPDAAPAATPDAKPAEPEKKPAEPKKDTPKPVEIDLDGIAQRLEAVKIAPGNYFNLAVNDKRVFFASNPTGAEGQQLLAVDIANKDIETKTIAKDISGYELSRDGKSLLVQRRAGISIIEASAGPGADLAKSAVNLAGWTFPIVPREEWRQMFIEAWRLERDYFYDTDMHGTNWKAVLDRYLPLVDRVATRAELSDLIAQMVAELSALHTFVRGGDERPTGPDDIAPASLGAILERDPAAGGYRVAKVFQADPDYPDRKAPLAQPGVDVAEGDIIERLDQRPVLDVADIAMLLRNRAGKQVLLHVKPKAGGDARPVIVTPISMGSEEDLRYHEWQYTRRLAVEKAGNNEFGYVHLRAMGSENMNEFARGFYPVFNRKGLIIDVRHNRGGNIDSWLLSRLLRKAWFFWQPRVGDPYWNMQLAFRGHVVVLCNERTASDGEAFSEGIKRLKIGTVLGTRTWGGEVWLSSSNTLVDGGLASASEIGVYGPEGQWLIEGHGVEPDIVVDNLPHATFLGQDAQLDAAIALLKKKVQDDPVDVPPAPKHPDKSWGPNSRGR